MSGLTLREKIGQMIMAGWTGATEADKLSYSDHARTLIKEIKVCGLCLFAHNIDTPEQVAEMTNELQSNSDTPLLISVDQEGGMVSRFRPPFTVFPGNMALGATGSSVYARLAAEAVGKQLAAMGVNMNLAPSVDVNINPDNPIIGVRSYGESPELVAELGAATVKGYQSAGVLSCAKHFPGHGDTSTDTHHALPMIPYGRDRLDSVELVPFRAAVHAGVDAIMTTHIIFPALDKEYPATLSEKILKGLLRDEMAYNGIVTTDCLEMKAIADNFGVERSAVLAVMAGADILLSSHTLEFQLELYEAMIKAVERGDIPEARIDQSVERILAAKEWFDLENRRKADMSAVSVVVGCPQVLAVEQEVAQKSITLVRNEDGIVPLSAEARKGLAVIGMHPATERFAQAFQDAEPSARWMRVGVAPTDDELAELDALVKGSSAVVVAVFPKEPWTKGLVDEDAQTAVVERILASGVPTVLIAAREPYGLRRYPNARTALATYGYQLVSVRAALDVVLGNAPAEGRLPVSIPGFADRGAGLIAQ